MSHQQQLGAYEIEETSGMDEMATFWSVSPAGEPFGEHGIYCTDQDTAQEVALALTLWHQTAAEWRRRWQERMP